MQIRNKSYPIPLLIVVSVLAFLALAGNAESARPQKHARWKYIVIHHSATRKGNAAIIDRYHRNFRHMPNGLAYHFVIDNGTSATADGEVEEGDRWKKQLPGGHAKQPWLNESGIGVCLVGNFNRQYPSRKQLDSLVALIKRLRATYDIPLSCIKGHKEFIGERTMCPGRNFPMKQVKERLKKSA
ncbi:MAG: peptidoglycan recognition family protein [Candidatus Aureabacteria bacterium]|nr:peptidoglycan recognition family protein [Candidatus Auribacterota bacterium]